MRSRTLARTCILLLGIGVKAYASDPTDPTKPREGRGLMFGLALGPSDTHFGGAEDLVLVIGGPTGTIPLLGGESLEARAGELVPRTLVPVDSEGVVPMRNQRGAAASLHSSSFYLGQAVGPIVYGYGFAHAGLEPSIVVGAAVVMTVGLVCSRLLRLRKSPP